MRRVVAVGNNDLYARVCIIGTEPFGYYWDARRNFSCQVQRLDRARKEPSNQFGWCGDCAASAKPWVLLATILASSIAYIDESIVNV
jgi:hypothetical protein